MIPFDSAHQGGSTDTNIVQKNVSGDDLGEKNRKLGESFLKQFQHSVQIVGSGGKKLEHVLEEDSIPGTYYFNGHLLLANLYDNQWYSLYPCTEGSYGKDES